MKLISNARVPDGLLATMTLLSEKPRHGVTSWESAPHPGIDERNCTAAIGLHFRCSDIVSGTVDAPKNAAAYSPACLRDLPEALRSARARSRLPLLRSIRRVPDRVTQAGDHSTFRCACHTWSCAPGAGALRAHGFSVAPSQVIAATEQRSRQGRARSAQEKVVVGRTHDAFLIKDPLVDKRRNTQCSCALP